VLKKFDVTHPPRKWKPALRCPGHPGDVVDRDVPLRSLQSAQAAPAAQRRSRLASERSRRGARAPSPSQQLVTYTIEPLSVYLTNGHSSVEEPARRPDDRRSALGSGAPAPSCLRRFSTSRVIWMQDSHST
jgi:hypothetical protein